MQFGVFDHVDADGQPLDRLFETRLKVVEAYDRLGFRSYHPAEHHFTPLGIGAAPSVWLSAVAQRTRRLRFGPLQLRVLLSWLRLWRMVWLPPRLSRLPELRL